MTIKLVCIDIDDTLLNSKRVVMPTTRDAITAAIAAGVHVALCSGRPLAGVRPFLNELGMTRDDQYVITFNGAVVESVTGRVLHNKRLPENAYATLAAYAREHNLPFNIVDADSTIITPDRDIDAFTVVQAAENSAGLLVRDVGDLATDVVPIKGIFCGDEAMLDAAEDDVRATLGADYAVIRAGRNFIELMAPGVDKGSGVAQLAAHLGINPDEIMALGDEGNDIAMFDYVGLAVAMGNGSDEAKAHANVVTASNDDDGLALALKKYVL
ncbi:Cof-type HAD-IIB family hydrolase [Lacticaseibacillus pabuli]|uniref:Cof-type HAD-IIB family hydrolase n=1 Tax=Lacticaseibacillus pabuli TaxID=3025672 RepID=A0ABY7WRQ1_9LACO|nr:Cof-type HAD-IIB family hydrolase [Lacticaseibacillus sp. KACC 23028]WDF82862.1 Cof-type HAD-IIB family hydrolase [Lacticaseibacillus sp. KACC 23028]